MKKFLNLFILYINGIYGQGAAVGINVALVGLTLLGVPSPVANGTNVSVLVKGN